MSKEQILLLIKRYSISIIRGYYEFKDVHVNLKPHVTRCLDNHGFGHRVDEDYRKIYEAEYGSKKNEKEPETSEETEATESEETTEE